MFAWPGGSAGNSGAEDVRPEAHLEANVVDIFGPEVQVVR